MGGLQARSARRSASVAAALVIAGLMAGLVVFFAVSRTPGLTPSLLGRLPGSSATPAAVGGPRLAASGPAVADPGTRAAERALLAPSPTPTRLTIPKLGVDAVVESVGVAADGSMAVPSQPDHVAWYQPGVRPGDAGDALIDGHFDWWTGPAVFWHLGNLRRGDQVNVLRADGSQLTFVVDSTKTYPWNARTDGLVTTTGPPSISLVTCSGTWDRQRQTYLNRLVVHATLIATAPVQTPGDEGG
jgi:sortase (surface protein transpeptidase)